MTFKAFIIAAATVASTATMASAVSYFELPQAQSATGTIALGTVRAESNGVVEVYDFGTGEIGGLIGTQDVFAGANADVRIDTPFGVRRDVIAVLKVDGEIVASETYRVIR